MKKSFPIWLLAMVCLVVSVKWCRAADANVASPEGGVFVGNQLESFRHDADGAITATKDSWINLYYTEGRPFKLTGQVWLGGMSPTLSHRQDLPDGFALFIREWDSLHRYSLTSRNITVKRRSYDGVKAKKIVNEVSFEKPPQNQWMPFVLESSAASLRFEIGTNGGAIFGPLDMDGANKIVLAPGTKIKDVRLEILEAAPTPTGLTNDAASSTSAAVQPDGATAPLGTFKGANGNLGLSLQGVPGRSYLLEFKNDLNEPTWTPMQVISGSNGTSKVEVATGKPQGFYRVVPLP